jgi:hypothetical protein
MSSQIPKTSWSRRLLIGIAAVTATGGYLADVSKTHIIVIPYQCGLLDGKTKDQTIAFLKPLHGIPR